MTATPPSTSTDTASAILAPPTRPLAGHFGWNLMPPSKRTTSAFM